MTPRSLRSGSGWPRMSLQALPRLRRDAVMQGARTGASGSSPSQLAPLRLLLSILTRSPIPSLVSSCLADISGCLGTAPSSGKAGRRVEQHPDEYGAGRAGPGWAQGGAGRFPPAPLGQCSVPAGRARGTRTQRWNFGCAGTGDSGLLC